MIVYGKIRHILWPKFYPKDVKNSSPFSGEIALLEPAQDADDEGEGEEKGWNKKQNQVNHCSS